MDYVIKLLQSTFAKKIISIGILVTILYLCREMLNLFLFTFVFTYLFYNMQNFVFEKLKRIIPVKRPIITIGIYSLLVLGIAFVLYKYIPSIVSELIYISNQVMNFDISSYESIIGKEYIDIAKEINFNEYLKEVGGVLVHTVSDVGKIGITMVIAFILSLFLILEKEEVMDFMRKLEKSNVSSFYLYYKELGKNFLNSFGKMIKVQFTISFINSIISVIALMLLGFPQVLGLGVMIFILGLIPVAGTLISFIPLSIIAFNIGGIMKVVYVIGMIVIIHALESYILNPKLMSMKTKLPVFFTFAILIVSEELIGIWGLLIGIPLFIFILDLLDVELDSESHFKKTKKQP